MKAATWTYTHAPAPETGVQGRYVLTQVSAPEAGFTRWTFGYGQPDNGPVLTSLTTPFGGRVTYRYARAAGWIKTVYRDSFVVFERTVQPDHLNAGAAGTWTFAYAQGTNKDESVVTTPCGRVDIPRRRVSAAHTAAVLLSGRESAMMHFGKISPLEVLLTAALVALALPGATSVRVEATSRELDLSIQTRTLKHSPPFPRATRHDEIMANLLWGLRESGMDKALESALLSRKAVVHRILDVHSELPFTPNRHLSTITSSN